MKIFDMIKILGLDTDESLPIIPDKPGKQPLNELSIYAKTDGVHFWENATIWFLSIDEKCKEEVDEIMKSIEDQIKETRENNQRELYKYVAVVELLKAIDNFNGGNGNFDMNTAQKYVGTINNKINESLDFADIQQMVELIEFIKKDSLYKELYFYVTEVQANKKERYRGGKAEEKKYKFGNIYHEKSDVVHITVYNDYVELNCDFDERTFEGELKINREYTFEEKIFKAFDNWRNFYKN